MFLLKDTRRIIRLDTKCGRKRKQNFIFHSKSPKNPTIHLKKSMKAHGSQNKLSKANINPNNSQENGSVKIYET